MHFVKAPSDNKIIDEIVEKYEIVIEKDERTGNTKIKSDNSMKELDSKKAIEAYNLGFSVNDSMDLFEEEIDMRVIELKSLSRNRKRLKQNKSRLIGSGGRTKEIIEELTNTKISIKGSKVGVIGNIIDVDYAMSIIHKIMNGADRSTVYRELEQYNSSGKRSIKEI